MMNETRRSPASYAKPPVMHGQDNPRWVAPLQFTCRHCGAAFERKPWQVRGSSPTYCSTTCRNDYRRQHEAGERSPFYVGGQKTYRGRGWQAIRAAVVAEQGGRCARCRKFVGKSLPVNHVIPFRYFDTAEAANARTNLVGLCQSCHMKAEPRRTELFGRHSNAS